MNYKSPLNHLADHHCELCPLHEYTDRVCVFGNGNPASRVMIVGEAPGAEEERSGQVFMGRAGQLMNRALAHAGLSREDIYVTNAVKCRPPENRKPENWEVKTCAGSYLARELEEVDPTHLLLVGNAALQAVARKSGRS